MYGSMEESTPAAEAPALGPAEIKAVRELLSATSKTTPGDDARPAGLLHEPQELSTSTLAKLEAASDEVELQASVWDASMFLFNPVAGRSASVFAFLLLLVNVFMQGSFAFYLIDGLDEKPLTNDDVNELKWWRRHVAHSLEFYNEEKGESLARRVCNEDYGLEGSGFQLELHEILNDYFWDSLDSYEAWAADARSNNSTVRTPYWLGRNLCVRGRGHKPLSLFCPEACGCHRGDQDCPLTCPARDTTTPTCPAHQSRTAVLPEKDAGSAGYGCPRRPQTHSFDVGFSAHDFREALSPRPPPPTNCAAASTGACLDDGCCAYCGEGSCAPGYTYAGQFVFDKELLASTYPDFNPICSASPCGHTCCVPSNGTAQTIAGG